MPAKRFAAGVVVISAAVALTCEWPADVATPRIQPIAFGAPLPLDPAADLPTAGQLFDLLNALQDPNVSFSDKSHLVEGGISPMEAHLADTRLKQAVAHGELPLKATVTNIVSTGANTVSADVTISGPKLTPVTQNLTFVDQGGWKISRASAVTLLEETGAARS
ncbi:hypothetical protein [Mycobacterium paragordonae]|uniref:hypothetical protein n=1 Tax=Mycobacterium paragordonae TaxID=1389713 RepID=UPI0013C4DC29